MKIKFECHHDYKKFSIILFLVSVLAMVPILVNEFFNWGTLEALFFNLSNIIFAAFISYLFYKNKTKYFKAYSPHFRRAFFVIFMLPLIFICLLSLSQSQSQDMPASIFLFGFNIFFIIPVFVVYEYFLGL